MQSPLVRMQAIRKTFGSTVVLDNAQLELLPGEVHVLAGENGAGKSTLINILSGIYTDWEGTVEYFGVQRRLASVQMARDVGVSVIHQELSLVPGMSIANNLFLGRNLTALGLVKRAEQDQAAKQWLSRVGLETDPQELVENLPLAAQQLVEIAKALSTNARVLVMDEPTSALSAADVNRLFALIGDLRSQGHAILYITHKMEEIERLADRITVLRDGSFVGTSPASDLPVNELIRWMVGREVTTVGTERRTAATGEPRLQVSGFGVRGHKGNDLVRDFNVTVRRGEVVGLAGLQGSGITELLEGLFGAHGDAARGSITVDGHAARIKAPSDAIQHRMALVTSDRKAKGLNLEGSVVQNIAVAALPELSPWAWRNPGRERAAAVQQAQALHLKTPSMAAPVSALSGGNQQKVVLAKWMLTRPHVLLLDEPTRGVDIGAKEEIYRLIRTWTGEGTSILLNSTELPELLALSDRILVLHRGEVTAHFDRSDASAEAILSAAMGQASIQ